MPTEPAHAASPRLSPAAVRWALWSSVALLVFFGRMWLAHAWGSAVPFWDEWDVEAVGLYHPWLAGTLHWTSLARAHNEHHLLLTRLVDLFFFVVHGRWEPWSQIVLNAGLHAATALALVALFWRALSARARIGLAVGVAVLFCATCGWQNALLGIQSQVYFSSLLAMGAIAGLLLAPAWSQWWWAGWLAALLALFSFAAGVLAAVAVLLTGLVAPAVARSWKWNPVSLAAITAIPVAAFGLFVEPAGQLELHSHTVAQFYATFSRCLSWPYVNSPVWWIVLQAPLVLLLADAFRERRFDAIDRCALALVLFAALQAAAVAHNRAAGLIDFRPLSRYQDPLLLGAAAQLFCALRWATRHGRSGRMLALGWSALTVAGLITLTTYNLTVNLPYKRLQDRANLAQVRAYLGDHDGTVFTKDPLFPGPHPQPQNVERVLDDPILRPYLPRIFFTDQTDEQMQPWLIAQGRTLFFVALALFLIALFMEGVRASSP